MDGNWLIQAHEDVTTYAGREVNFSLKVEFDAHSEHGILELAVGRDGTAEEVACAMSCQKACPPSGVTGEKITRKLTDGAVGGAGKTGKCRLDEGVGGHLHPHVHVGRGLLVLLGSGDIGGLGGPVLRLVVGVSPRGGSDAGGISARVGNTGGIALGCRPGHVSGQDRELAKDLLGGHCGEVVVELGLENRLVDERRGDFSKRHVDGQASVEKKLFGGRIGGRVAFRGVRDSSYRIGFRLWREPRSGEFTDGGKGKTIDVLRLPPVG